MIFEKKKLANKKTTEVPLGLGGASVHKVGLYQQLHNE